MARELPIQNGRLTTDLDANGFKIKNLPPGSGFTQEQADWSQTDSSAVDFIKNKPTIPAAVQVVAPSTDPSDAGKAADAKATGDALAGKLSKSEAEAGFTEWTVTGMPAGATDVTLTFFDEEPHSWQLSYTDGEGLPASEIIEGEADAVELHFSNKTATRTRLPTMADVNAKVPANTAITGATKCKITYDSKGLVTNGADLEEPDVPFVRYEYDTQYQTEEMVAVDDTDPNNPISYLETAGLLDRAENIIKVTGEADELRLSFPTAVSGKVRDFGIRVEVGGEEDTSEGATDPYVALTAPALVPPAGVTLENADGEIPALADGTATAAGVTLLYFSETSPGVFLVKGEQVEEVS